MLMKPLTRNVKCDKHSDNIPYMGPGRACSSHIPQSARRYYQMDCRNIGEPLERPQLGLDILALRK